MPTLSFNAIVQKHLEGFGRLTDKRVTLAMIEQAPLHFTNNGPATKILSSSFSKEFEDVTAVYQYTGYVTPGGSIAIKIKNGETPFLLRDLRFSVAAGRLTDADTDLISSGMIQLIIGQKKYAEQKLWQGMDTSEPQLTKPLLISRDQFLMLTFYPGPAPCPPWTADVAIDLVLEFLGPSDAPVTADEIRQYALDHLVQDQIADDPGKAARRKKK